jgi:hypothetical protein
MQIGLVAANTIARTRYGGSPAYTRLEPQSVSGDPTPGVTAAVHDPLWMLLRQWQFGEFAGEDNGRPLGVAVEWSSTPLATLTVGGTATTPGGSGPAATIPIGDATLLDPAIQGGAASTATPRARAEAGRALAVALEEAGAGATAALLAQQFPFPTAEIAAADPRLARLLRAGADGRAIAASLGAGGTAGWLPGPVQGVAAAWLAWWRASVEPVSGPTGWDRARLEHRYAIDTGRGLRFSAVEHVGRSADWWAMDATGVAAPASATGSANLLAQPLRFPGMPADRYWEFEDGAVNLGGMAIEPNDPVRRALVDFATLFGADWFSAPVTVPAGAMTTITSLKVTDSFGVTTTIDPPADEPFRLFRVTRTDAKGHAPGLLTVPAASVTLDGPPTETVLILRDEAANLGWAVEERVEDGAGGSRLRRDEPPVAVPVPAATGSFPPGSPAPELRYTLVTEIPRWWIPLVPMPSDGQGGFVLRKGTMTEVDDSRSRLLAGPGAVDFLDEEIPAAGLRVDRVPRIARGPDGSLRRWTAFQVRAISVPAASGLAFDGAAPI